MLLDEEGKAVRKQFLCGKAMACQANEATKVFDMLEGVKLIGHGAGLIQEIIIQGCFRGRADCYLKSFDEEKQMLKYDYNTMQATLEPSGESMAI